MIALIILAAGESSRLGQPKQNLLFQNKTLLQRAIETGISSKCRPIIVVLGANADRIDPIILNKNIRIIYNDNWHEGMASSIRIAIKEAKKNINIEGAIIMLCDQPFVNASLINDMLQKKKDTHQKIIACSYNNTIGVPVLFDKPLFAELLILKGNEGAKNMLMQHPQAVISIPFDKGDIDIDTMDDYNSLISMDLST